MSTLFKLVILIALTTQTKCANWGYAAKDTTPDKWATISPKMCAGLVQSPININNSETAFIGDIKPTVSISLASGSTDKVELKNTGHTIEMKPVDKKWIVSLTESKPTEYTVVQAHFHWGNDNTKGSEHTIDGNAFPLEMHIVSYNSELYSNFDEAKAAPNGLAVIAVLFKLETTVASDVGLDAFGDFIKKLSDCALTTHQKVEIDSFNPKVLLPNEKPKFYRYLGSLTTPPCTQNVQWTVIQDTMPVKANQLALFRNLDFGAPDSGKMANNFRPVQALNPAGVLQQRIVYKSWKDEAKPGSAFSVQPYSSLVVLLLTTLIRIH